MIQATQSLPGFARARWRVVITAIVLAVLGLGVTGAWLFSPYPVAALQPGIGTSLSITDRRGEPLRVLPVAGGGRARWVPLSRIAPPVLLATLAGEDHRFFAHVGVDVRAIARSIWLLVTRRRALSGASTVTMQLARTLEPHPRTLLGKLREMIVALRIERTLDKHAILELYLNRVTYGGGAIGIEAAAWSMFGKSAAALSAGEATLLAVLPRAPIAYDLRHPPSRAKALARRGHVLGLMQAQGWLSADQRARIVAEPLLLQAGAPADAAPHFVDWVLQSLDSGARTRGGTIATTLDLPLQRRLEAALRAHLADRPDRASEAGLVVIDPSTGAVRAMIGSPDYRAPQGGQLNITTAPRHPGSALKPFVYALSIERGASPATLADDSLAGLPRYRPSGRVRERGLVRYREALAGSFNLAAMEVLDDVGVAPVLERLRAAGLGPLTGSAGEYGVGLALGSARVRLVDLAAAYGAFVNGGWVHRPRSHTDGSAAGTRLFSPETSWLVMDMLADPGARRAVFGANLPFDLPFRVAAKTGTSAGFADTLAVAATREAVVAAWAGAFDGSGTRGSLAMWSAGPLARAALLAVADQQGGPLTLPPRPAGIVSHEVCRVSGLRPAATCPSKREHFVGPGPSASCTGRH